MFHIVNFNRKSYAVISVCVICLSAIFATIGVTYQNAAFEKLMEQKQKEFAFIASSTASLSALQSSPFEYGIYQKHGGGLEVVERKGEFFETFKPAANFVKNQYRIEQLEASFFAVFGEYESHGLKLYFAEDITDFKKHNIQIIYFSIVGSIVLILGVGFAVRIGYSTLFLKIERLSARLKKRLEEARHAERSNASLLGEYKAAVDASNIVSKTDKKGVITYVNQAFCDTSGYSEEELLGKPQSIVRHPNMPKSVFRDMWETILSKRIYKGVIENRRKDGCSYFVDATIVPILDLNGEIIEFVGIRHDITEFINNKQKLFTNALTGLPNRYKLSSDLNGVKKAKLAILNIDSFKIINEFYGNQVGDCALIEVANRLSTIFTQKGYVVYKLSADEYGIFCEDCAESFEADISEGVHLICSKSVKCGDIEMALSLSIGIAAGDEALLEKASMALGFAKKNRKQFAVYDASMLIAKNYEKNLLMSKTLREAIEGDWLMPYFQPIVDVKTGEVKKYESLIRIVKPNGDELSPFMFLDVAKATRLYPHITRAVILKSFEVFKNKTESFSINISIEDILDSETSSFVIKTLADYNLGNRVIFEILESEGIENYEEAAKFLYNVKNMGAKIAIDDFGSGYSNFEHLARLNVDIIKIDGSLIKNIDVNKNAEIITQTIVSFAKKLNIECVAEFVCSKEVYDKIKEIGVDYAQGYYFGKPSPMSSF